jgi:soluble lytic murein transglycosylase
MHHLTRFIAVFGLVAALLAPLGATASEHREQFLLAMHVLRSGQEVNRSELHRQLEGYILAPYLDYYYLRARLAEVDDSAVKEFLGKHGELPVAGILRDLWLRHLAERGQWRAFLDHYEPGPSVELRCYELSAHASLNGVEDEWIDKARELWMVGHSQPKACDPVFAELLRRKAISGKDVWRRVELAMGAGNRGQANYLGRYLSDGDKVWLQHWLALDNEPIQSLRMPPFDLDHPRAGLLVRHGVRKAARQDPAAAWGILPGLHLKGALSEAELQQLQRFVVLQGAISRLPETLAWIDALPAAAVDDEVRLWRATLIRADQDWPRLLAAIADLPEAQAVEAEWRYWRAFALECTGERRQADELYAELAKERHYYGFLAADVLDLPYNMQPQPVHVSDVELAAIAARPGIARAVELFRLNLLVDARREWQAEIGRLDLEHRRGAAVLASGMGWHDRAIITANSAGLHDALDLRFPMPFRDRVEYYSMRNQLDIPFTFALLRKESAFMPDAVSSAGARGLMQVMPATGKGIARRLKEPPPSAHGLMDVETNLRFGSAYLRQVLDRFGNNAVLAAAAYNAGPRRVDDWLERNAGQPPALWIENISFRETRQYVKDVLAFASVFQWQLHGSIQRRLSDVIGVRSQHSTSQPVSK